MARKQKTIHYLYKTTCLITGRFYIGIHSTNNLEDGYMGSGKRLRYSIRKYGKENHDKKILEFFDSRESLAKKENELVNENLLKDKLCMNIVYGGNGGYISQIGVKKGRKIADEILYKKYGEDFKSIISKNYYDNLTSDDRKKLNEKIKKGQKECGYDFGKTFKGKKHKEESKRKIGLSNSIKQKGEKNSQFGTCWITNGTENKKIKKGDTIPNGWRLGRLNKR